MINKDTIYDVKNRSASVVVYRIPEDNIRRDFAPGETKRLTFGEIEKLSFQPGGRELMASFLQIQNESVVDNLNIPTDLEYNMSEREIVELMVNGSLEEFMDCLDFAPTGIIDLIKKFSVEIPLNDIAKRKAIKDITGFDVDKAIANTAAAKENTEENTSNKPTRRVSTTQKRRVQTADKK